LVTLALLDALSISAVHILGGGSNVVIADEGIDGLVIHVSVSGVNQRVCDGTIVYSAGAGEPWDPFVAASVEANCAGLECLSGIPGRVGGTPVQNVGAYGQDVSESITQVRVVDRGSGIATVLTNSECGFGYRTSRFKRADMNRFIVTAVDFTLARGGRPALRYADVITYFEAAGADDPTLADVRRAVLDIRRRKGMVLEPGNLANRSCGSFFVNPVVSRDDLSRIRAVAADDGVPHYVTDATSVKVPAAWLIERAGFPKGVVRGPVGISPFQAQAIINRGGAAAADVLALATEIKRAVWEVFRVSIVPEPVFLGFGSSSELRFLLTEQRSH
jgi:UDP-N-acetylmuramate dehydrogenase